MHAGALSVGLDIGTGPVVVLLPGFGLAPALYRATAELLAGRARVVVPDPYRVRGPWRHANIVDRLAATIAGLDSDRVTIVGHSFSGAVELEYATRFPDRITELVFVDTLASERELGLADEAMRHPLRLLWMATPQVASAFGTTVLTHPRQIAEAAWFGFTSGRARESERWVALALPAHVLWASRDSVLSRADGRRLAAELHASFTVADAPNGERVDHDWIYRHPQLFVDHLDALDLVAFRPRTRVCSDDVTGDEQPAGAHGRSGSGEL